MAEILIRFRAHWQILICRGLCVVIFACLQIIPLPARPLLQNPANPSNFEAKVLPIFQDKCLACHGEEVMQNGLDLRTRESVLKGGESGPSVVPGSPGESLLFKKVSSGLMPPAGAKLSSQEIDLIRHWIEGETVKPAEGSETKNQGGAPEVAEQEVMVTIFYSKCITCHGKWKRDADLDLRTRAGLLKGGKSGPALVPGRPEESLVFKRVSAAEMPPKVAKGSPHFVRPVTAGEIVKLRKWIEAGAPQETEKLLDIDNGPDPLVKDKDRGFWSFQPPRRFPVPAVRHQELVRTPIDAFVLEKLEAKGLRFSREADRLTLLRRAYFDLLGLPPTPRELDTFLNDQRPDAYERMIDSLLSSPHYGERWGKYWLDAAGYADSNGKIDADRIRPNAWRYRDYVIRSLNADKPYNQFLLEQVAGDELFDFRKAKELTPEQRDDLVATGFLRTAADDTDEAVLNLVPYRLSVLTDQVNIFSSAVLGLTLECARCHNHKYDPIPQRDYYRFMAIFQSAFDPYDWRIANTVIFGGEEGQVKVPLKYQRFLDISLEKECQEVDAFNAPIQQEIKQIEASLSAKEKPLREKVIQEKLSKLPDSVKVDLQKALSTPPDKRTVLEKYLVEKFEPSLKVERKELEERFKDFKEAVVASQKAIETAKLKLKPEPKIPAVFDVGGAPTPSYILRRGDPNKPGDRVEPGVPSVLKVGLSPYKITKPDWTTDTSGRRLALARWLIQPNHPLTSRVLVNRVWQHHFSKGLVDTPGNFGKTGSRPSHPELLDWMATEFVNQGWSLKALHRLIMTSTVYRQSSFDNVAPPSAEADETLMSRFPMKRLDAEAIHDSILQVAGRLDETLYGPPEAIEVTSEGEVIGDPSKQGYRRSVYLLQRRSLPLTLLELFDSPRMDPNCVRRVQSIVPTQALELWNSEMLRENSRYMAGRIIDAAEEDLEREIVLVYKTALARLPSEQERKLALASMERLTQEWLKKLDQEVPAEPKTGKAHWLALATFCHTILNSAEFIYID
ncbi:MAG: DUF1549 domain-containing protein [Terriglobia bacterium]